MNKKQFDQAISYHKKRMEEIMDEKKLYRFQFGSLSEKKQKLLIQFHKNEIKELQQQYPEHLL